MSTTHLSRVFRARKSIEEIDGEQFFKSCKPLLDSIDSLSTEDLYALALLLQTERLHDDELFYFSYSSAWQNSKSIVDLGCGPGFSLNFLKTYFPDKIFAGVELSAAFAAMAGELTGLPIAQADISTHRPDKPFDFGLVKAVLQHMPDDSGFLQNLGNVIRPGGYLLVSDAHPDHEKSSMTSNPSVLSLEKMYADLEKHQAGRRFAIRGFVERAKRQGWEVHDTSDAGVAMGKTPEKLCFAKEEIIRNVLISKLLGPSVAPSDLHAELKIWLQSSNSFATSIGLRVLLQRME